MGPEIYEKAFTDQVSDELHVPMLDGLAKAFVSVELEASCIFCFLFMAQKWLDSAKVVLDTELPELQCWLTSESQSGVRSSLNIHNAPTCLGHCQHIADRFLFLCICGSIRLQ